MFNQGMTISIKRYMSFQNINKKKKNNYLARHTQAEEIIVLVVI